jgi:hypothetical protein
LPPRAIAALYAATAASAAELIFTIVRESEVSIEWLIIRSVDGKKHKVIYSSLNGVL